MTVNRWVSERAECEASETVALQNEQGRAKVLWRSLHEGFDVVRKVMF